MCIRDSVTGIAWQWREAEAARIASEADLADALESVDRVLGHLGSSALADIPQAKQLRVDVLNDALEFFQRFQKRNPEDPRIAMQVAESHAQVARIRNALGQADEARREHEKAIAEFEILKDIAPDRKKWLYLLAKSHSAYAWFLHRSSDHNKAATQIQKCVALRRQLAEG